MREEAWRFEGRPRTLPILLAEGAAHLATARPPLLSTSPPPHPHRARSNLDHLFGPEYPHFTSSITEDCCSDIGPGAPSGGLWVLEPSISDGLRMWGHMVRGEGVTDLHGMPELNPATGLQSHVTWRLGDMAIVRAVFTVRQRNSSRDRLWPWLDDGLHGYAPGVRAQPLFAAMDDAAFNQTLFDMTDTPYKQSISYNIKLAELVGACCKLWGGGARCIARWARAE